MSIRFEGSLVSSKVHKQSSLDDIDCSDSDSDMSFSVKNS